MIASVYIKDGNIHLYNENDSYAGVGEVAYELGRALLDFVCYEPERFDEGFSLIASAFDYEFAHIGAMEPEFIVANKESMAEYQRREVYVYFYRRMFIEFIYTFIESPQMAVAQLAKHIHGAEERLSWAMDFEWPVSSSPLVATRCADKEKRLYRAAMDVVRVMSEHLHSFQKFIIQEIEALLYYREEVGIQVSKPLNYIGVLDEWHTQTFDKVYYLDQPFRTFYGCTTTSEVEQLYEIDEIQDLFRFEFVKMIEHSIFIKKCKNCERFFIPRRRADAAYCERVFGDGPRRCSEIGAMLRYEKKVAENPILEAYSKAYKRFNSRTRVKKMTQAEFLSWSEQARKRRDQCLAGELPFEDFVAWLEQGRIRKSRGSGKGLNSADIEKDA